MRRRRRDYKQRGKLPDPVWTIPVNHSASAPSESITSTPNTPFCLTPRAMLEADSVYQDQCTRNQAGICSELLKPAQMCSHNARAGRSHHVHLPFLTATVPMHVVSTEGSPHSSVFICDSICLFPVSRCSLLISRPKKIRKTNPIAPLLATPPGKNKPNQTQFLAFQGASKAGGHEGPPLLLEMPFQMWDGTPRPRGPKATPSGNRGL